MSNADTAPVGAKGELGPGKIFKKTRQQTVVPGQQMARLPTPGR